MQTAIDHVENLFLTCHQSDHLCGSKTNGPDPLHALVLTSIQEHDWNGGPWEVTNVVLFIV